MPREAASSPGPEPTGPIRARVEVDAVSLHLLVDGRCEQVTLRGSRVFVRDATCSQRFVRQVAVRTEQHRVDLITPPEQGAIAPRAARLPRAPRGALIVDPSAWEPVSQWLRSGGRLRGRTIPELARLACVATSQFAIALGERIAHIAAELTWERLGPMRGGVDARQLLEPLAQAARQSARAQEALVAALSRGATLRPYAFP